MPLNNIIVEVYWVAISLHGVSAYISCRLSHYRSSQLPHFLACFWVFVLFIHPWFLSPERRNFSQVSAACWRQTQPYKAQRHVPAGSLLPWLSSAPCMCPWASWASPAVSFCFHTSVTICFLVEFAAVAPNSHKPTFCRYRYHWSSYISYKCMLFKFKAVETKIKT